MASDIRFKAGEPVTYVVRQGFTFGANNMPFRRGQEIDFDGSIATIDGETLSMPGLRGAVKTGWLVPLSTYDENAVVAPVSANIQVRHPTKGGDPFQPPERTPIVTVETDERVVGHATRQAQQTQQNNQAYHQSKEAARNQGARQLPAGVEDQDGVAVRTLKTPAKSRSELRGDNVGALLSSAKAPVIEPMAGVTEDDLMARMTEEEREEYHAKKDMHRSAYEADVQRAAAKHGTGGRKVVARVAQTVKPKTQDGITVGVTTGGGIETEDVTDPTARQRTQTVESEGIRFTQTNMAPEVPQRHPRDPMPAMVDPRRMIARALCKDFPENYSFEAPPKRRIARLQADYSDKPEVIRAAFAAETDEGKQLILGEFPEVFAA